MQFKNTVALWLAVCPLWVSAEAHKPSTRYPIARQLDVVDNYHGTQVADPYRWLEDAGSPETAAWAEAENRLTAAYLAGIPGRERIKSRLITLVNYERYGGMRKKNGRYFFTRNNGLQNQDVLYVAERLTAPPRTLLDPNTLRSDGTLAVTDSVVSPDAKWLAYATADAGSDWIEWHVRDVETGQDLPDLIKWSKFYSVSWTSDSRGFYYVRFPEPEPQKRLTGANAFAKLYFHGLGDPSSRDRVAYERPDKPNWAFLPRITDDGRYLVILVDTYSFGKNLVFYQDLRDTRQTTVELVSQLQAAYDFLGNDGTVFYFHTTDHAPKGRIIAIDIAQRDPSRWREVVPQRSETMESARFVDRKFVVSYLKDTFNQIRIYADDGRPLREVPLPMPGRVSLGFAGQGDSETFYSFGNAITPRMTYRLNMKALESAPIWQSKATFDPSRYEFRQIFYTSKDGTRVPMSLAHRKGLHLDGYNPTLLYGYGGFDVVLSPAFHPMFFEWMEMGGVFAVANLRGGGEYGEAWHEAGKGAHKQNVFDDFIAAAEWLIANRYTTPAKLAIEGESNGGLLVGAVLNQRPDLFGAAVAGAGVMDMLRFQKFTIGSAWIGEYGSSDSAADFPILRAYSPLHNILPGTKYPATLVTTADHDDRVVPGHSFKYAAALQAAQAGDAPILLRIDTAAGHGTGTPLLKLIDRYADILSFLARELELDTEPAWNSAAQERAKDLPTGLAGPVVVRQ